MIASPLHLDTKGDIISPQIAIIEGIITLKCRMIFIQFAAFHRKSKHLFIILIVKPTAHRLIMIQDDVITTYIIITSLCQFKTQVNIIVGNRKFFIKAANLIELCPINHQTGAGHCQPVIFHTISREIIRLCIIHMTKCMRRSASQV